VTVRTIAIHMPQFHPDPKDDAWWVKSSTVRAKVALGLRPEAIAIFKELAETTGGLIVSHQPAALQAADAVWELANGRITRSNAAQSVRVGN